MTYENDPMENQPRPEFEMSPPRSPVRGSGGNSGGGHSGLAIAAFVVSIIAFLSCWFPLAGLLGGLGALLAFADLIRSSETPKKTGLSVAALVFGILAMIVGIWWIMVIRTSSCPHVYSFDGEEYVIDADPLSGSLFRGAESRDMDRLEKIVAVDGEYRLKVINERQEIDYLNDLSLQVVDHDERSEVLPTQEGELVGVFAAAVPLACQDGRGRDVLDGLLAEDGEMFSSQAGDFSPDAAEEPLEQVTCTFAAPDAERAVLVVRGHNTQFAADVFAAYLAEMGSGLDELLRSMEDCDDYPQYVSDQMDLLGLHLGIEVWDGGRWVRAGRLGAIGPAVIRSQAAYVDIPAGVGEQVQVRFGMAPLLWELDQVLLGQGREVEELVLQPTLARSDAGNETTGELTDRDDARVVLQTGEYVEVRFDAPPGPTEGLRRSVILSISGYYDVEVGGWGGVNPIAMWRHETGRGSFARFALREAER